MLKKILSGETCAKCRICCIFARYEVWETPVFTRDIMLRISAARPDAEFLPWDGGYIFKVLAMDENQLFTCPALTPTGCMLGDDKPFDCRIWPFRIMDIGGRRAITIAHICSALYSRPLSELVDFLKEGLADTIFTYADAHPEIVKPYYDGYPVLLFEKEQL